jgi:hypothetical protein
MNFNPSRCQRLYSASSDSRGAGRGTIRKRPSRTAFACKTPFVLRDSRRGVWGMGEVRESGIDKILVATATHIHNAGGLAFS